MKPPRPEGEPGPPRLSPATRAAHAGTGGPAPLGPAGEVAHALPLYQTSNFTYPDALAAGRAASGEGYLYSRHGNPTVAAFERAIADLEGAEAGLAFASGMAALSAAVFAATAPPAGPGELLVSEGLYGGTTELLAAYAPRQGLGVRLVPAWQTEAVAAALSPATRAVVIETLSNPLLRLPDLPALGALCRSRGVPLVVDSTAATPLLCRPLEHGATFVVHSASKAIGGHGDLIGGIVLGAGEALAPLRTFRTLTGAVMEPFSAWLAVRGLRTLPLRIERACANATRLAALLASHAAVRAVHHPSLPAHPDADRVGRLLAGPGALVSFELGSGDEARAVYDRVQVISRAASFGEVSSLLTHPATFSHASLPSAERARLGIAEGLLRLSVGIEAFEDLEADLLHALPPSRQDPR